MSEARDLEELLEFHKIRGLLKSFAVSSLGQALFDEAQMFLRKEEVESALAEVSEFKAILETDATFPLDALWDVRPALESARVAGALLPVEALAHIAQNLGTARRVRGYLRKRSRTYPHLAQRAAAIQAFGELEKQISTKIAFDTLEVKDSASAKLASLRKQIARAEQQARKAVEKLVKVYADKGLLQDAVVTFREGRLLLPVRAEHRGKVKGWVYDQSASGSTCFIEPQEAVEWNNKINDLRLEEAREVETILRELTDAVRPVVDELLETLNVLAHLDFVRAKARFAGRFRCTAPEINSKMSIRLLQGRHPLLLNKKSEDEVVPLDLRLGEEFNTLVITGPNAGGKTVALKTVGLFALMIRYGLPLPCHPDSSFPVFRRIFADIGDFQSIEQDLSTFSSHIKKMQHILARADDETLVLVDEIGVGTDPDEGAALAVAFLEELTRRGTRTVVTTHHGALKSFAYNTPGVENGSMEFEASTLAPTYRFRLGLPGSSYAIEISKRLGIEERVLQRARELLGSEKTRLENLILDLETRVQESQKLAEKLEMEKTRLEGLTKLYKERYETIKRRESELKKKALAESETILKQANAAIERAVRMIKEGQAGREVVAEARKLVAEQKARIAAEKKKLRQAEKEPAVQPVGEIAVGARVLWQPHNSVGTIVAVAEGEKKVLLQVGSLKVWVPVTELAAAGEREPAGKRSASVKVSAAPKDDVLPEVDLRGETLEDALARVDKFLDDALLAGWNQVRIIHGKGTGVLRKGIAEFLDKHPRVKSHKMAAWNEGDLGVTVVEFS